MLHPRRLVAVAVLTGALTGADARAEVQPLRITYEAHEGCPSAKAFLRELTQRTSRARAAAPDEAALVRFCASMIACCSRLWARSAAFVHRCVRLASHVPRRPSSGRSARWRKRESMFP